MPMGKPMGTPIIEPAKDPDTLLDLAPHFRPLSPHRFSYSPELFEATLTPLRAASRACARASLSATMRGTNSAAE